jgi:hypothetical protein
VTQSSTDTACHQARCIKPPIGQPTKQQDRRKLGLGTLERVDGNPKATHGHGEEALEVGQRLGSGYMQANAEFLLGRLALAAGDATEAERYVHDALGHLVAKGFTLNIPECFDILAAITATQESFEEAARLLGAAAAGRQRLGIVRFPPEPDFWTSVEHTTRQALGPDGYDTAFATGAALGTDEAVTYARRTRDKRSSQHAAGTA